MITPQNLSLFVKPNTPFANGRFHIELIIPQTLPYFEGHFPENPILPGVAFMDISLEALRVHAEVYSPLKTLKSAKYLGMVLPNDKIEIECIQTSPSDWQVLWKKEEKKLCDLVLSFG